MTVKFFVLVEFKDLLIFFLRCNLSWFVEVNGLSIPFDATSSELPPMIPFTFLRPFTVVSSITLVRLFVKIIIPLSGRETLFFVDYFFVNIMVYT